MTDKCYKDPERTEFRVICRYENGTELTWKVTDMREDAIRYIDNVDSRLRSQCDWLVYKVTISELAEIVHRVEKAQPSNLEKQKATLSRLHRS
jgi:hypothetical protein